jgi:5-formyltetrahydrofolate cyclo-ligase
VAFDSDADTTFTLQAKAELRKRMRALRNSIPAEARALRSEKVVERLAASTPFESATAVGLFWPMLERGEVDIRPVDAIARGRGKTVAYPFFEAPGEMTLRLALPDELAPRGHGFSEPPEGAPVIDTGPGLVIVVPALAVDLAGNRIGYGAGFYDRLLARMTPPARAIAVAYDFQVLADLPATEGDETVAMVITDARAHVVA